MKVKHRNEKGLKFFFNCAANLLVAVTVSLSVVSTIRSKNPVTLLV